MDKYMNEGIQDIENLEILSNDPFRKFGTPMTVSYTHLDVYKRQTSRRLITMSYIA